MKMLPALNFEGLYRLFFKSTGYLIMKMLCLAIISVCCLNSYASPFESLLQTPQEARDSYNVQREIARENNDTYTLRSLENNINHPGNSRDITSNYRNPAPRTYR